MNPVGSITFAEVFSTNAISVESLFSARSLGFSLWLGLAILTLSLLILMRTRWGQAKPLSKCVVLSVFAHILLFGYAYGTRLILDHPVPLREEIIDLTLVADEDDLEAEQEPDDGQRPWDRLAASLEMAPPADSLPRPENVQAAQPSRSEPEQPPDLAAAPPADQLAAAEPTRPTAEPPGNDVLKATGPGADPVSIEAPAPTRRSEPDPAIQPDGALLERPNPRDIAHTPPRRSPSADVTSEISDIIEPGSRLQRLVDVVSNWESGEAIADRRDSLAQAANDGTNTVRQQPLSAPDGMLVDVQQQLARVDRGATDSELRREGESNGGQSQRPSTASDPSPPRRLGDGEPLPELLSSRMRRDRDEVMKRYGGNGRTQSAVEAALAWLARQQESDGRWDASATGGGQETSVYGHNREGAGAEADTGISGLALLAFLAAGHTHLEGQYRQNVQRGLEFLLRTQREDGNLAGQARLYATMYCHGIAALALSEAYVLTGDYRLKPYVERAVEYTINAQHHVSGGWRYQPGDLGDTSQFGWQVMMLRSAELGGFAIPARTRDGMARFLRGVSSGGYGGLASYRPRERPSRPMTAEALTCRFFLNMADNQATIREASAFVLEDTPHAGEVNLYYWYYATIALFQLQDDQWRRWNLALQEQLLGSQRDDGESAGSWDPNTVWGGYGGRVYSTAMAALCLEVYYRYLPLYNGRR